MDEYITLAYGSGGKKTSELINTILVPAFKNDELVKMNDGACIDSGKGKIIFTTDSFVVKPLFFPGGDIGKLSVCGTINDICVCGGIPKYLSLAFIIEEGFPVSDLIKVVNSIKNTTESCGVKIVTGDTKVVEKGNCDSIYINTAGIGTIDDQVLLGTDRIKPGDKIIVSGTVGDHGLAIMAAREKLFISDILKSDCAPMFNLTQKAMRFKGSIKMMRDPTRGGLATTLKEFVECSLYGIKIYNELIPIKSEVRSACEILGIDPLYAANEGKIIIVSAPEDAECIISNLKEDLLGKDACIIGEVLENPKGKLLLDTGFGSVRIIDKLSGSQLPRIC